MACRFLGPHGTLLCVLICLEIVSFQSVAKFIYWARRVARHDGIDMYLGYLFLVCGDYKGMPKMYSEVNSYCAVPAYLSQSSVLQ